jgi:type IV pilus assembly protein PilY1
MVDVNINGGPDATKTAGSWKTILIGGMKLGGACRKTGDSCTGCVKTPILDPSDVSKGLGYSSYFALDITDPTNPQVLWEFSNEALGFSTTGPAVVKVSAQTGGVPDRSKNGKWFVVIGSGPTGPIDPNTHQFKGYSAQNLKVFVLELETGQLLRTFDSGINYAFAGSLVNGQIDFDQNDSTQSGYYQDEAVYFGFTKAENNPPLSTTKWNVGGVLRLFTKNSLNPADWALSKVIEGVGPVTAAVAKLQNYTDGQAWLFFGTGRFFFKVSDDIDDQNNGRSLYGVKEPCYSSSGINETCTSSVARWQLGSANASKSTDSNGWYIDLDTCTNAAGTEVSCSAADALYKPERNVTDPLATTTGAVFFTTTKPTADVCEFGGAAHLWAVYYNSGGSVSSSKLRGKALMQVSTGSIEEVDLRSAFTEKTDSSTGSGRRSTAVQGVPPAGAPPGILVPPPPVNRIFHIRER